MTRFHDRKDAGRQLAERLASYAAEHPIVLALPRGGVTVGYEVARALSAPLDVWVVRKVGVPWQEELGVGAVAEPEYLYLSDSMLRETGLSEARLADVIASKRREVAARVQKFRGGRPRPALRDRTVIVVDDGIATGGTIRAAVRSMRTEQPKQIVLAVPVAPPEEVRALETEVDRVIALLTPDNLIAIGYWYDDFTQVSDDEVVRLLDLARQEHAAAEPAHA
jgi:putative phosphoribosyl transferase